MLALIFPVENQRGVTLIELMISISILAIAVTLSLDPIFAISRIKRKVESQTSSRMDAKLVTNYLVGELRQVGGSFVRPWMALWVENNCDSRNGLPACEGSDRMTYSHIDQSVPACSVLTAENPNRFHFPLTMTHCCDLSLQGRQIITVRNGSFGSFYISNASTDDDQCWVDLGNGQAYGLNTLNPPAQFTDWSGADVAVVSTKTVYLDPVSKSLLSFQDMNNDGMPGADEVLIVSDQVYDFQVILGFDREPQDGRVDNLNSDQDEWLFNVASNDERLGAGGLTDVKLEDLRMVGLGVVTGIENSVSTSRSVMFDGPILDLEGVELVPSQSRIYLRSTLLFNN